MRFTPSLRSLVVIWALWAAALLGFQTLAQERMQPNRPDRATEWTANETARNSQRDKPYLIEPFMNNQVSWDSEFYLAIATLGYDNPDVRLVETPVGDFSMSYAFFPLYPYLMQVVRLPFTLPVFGLTPIGASALAGVIVALLGTLAGMIALYELTRDELGEAGGLRTAFMLLVFPSSFFLAQVYTEGLFVGLAFGCLALLHRGRLLPAAILAALATWTRSVGVLLVVPLALAWLGQVVGTRQAAPGVAGLQRLAGDRRLWAGLAAVLLPIGAYLLWRLAFGGPFDAVQESWFGRGAFDMERLLGGLDRAVQAILSGEVSAMRVYFLIEFGGALLAFAACLATARRYPLVTITGLLFLVVAVTSGAPQSWIRYVLAVPCLFVALGRWGRWLPFERGWTVFSLLLMGLLTGLFTWDMWVA